MSAAVVRAWLLICGHRDPQFRELRALPLSQLLKQTHQDWTLILVLVQLNATQQQSVHEALVVLGIPKMRVEVVMVRHGGVLRRSLCVCAP